MGELGEKLARASGGKLGQRLVRLRNTLAALDHAHQIVRNAEPLEGDSSPRADLGVSVVESYQKGSLRHRTDLLERLDTTNSYPPRRVPQSTDETVYDSRAVKVPQGSCD